MNGPTCMHETIKINSYRRLLLLLLLLLLLTSFLSVNHLPHRLMPVIQKIKAIVVLVFFALFVRLNAGAA